MTGKKTAKETSANGVEISPRANVVQGGEEETSFVTDVLRRLGGSDSQSWNSVLAEQVFRTLWLKHSDEEASTQRHNAAIAGLIGIGPKDELEGMLAAQIIAAHNAAMECHRRAMLGEQTFEGRRDNLNQANKLSRTYATLLEALNRHRGKGQQKVIVEHVHVHSGGQAIVGMVEGGAKSSDPEETQNAKQIAYAPQPAMRSTHEKPQPVRSTSDAERQMSHARRNVNRSTEGE